MNIWQLLLPFVIAALAVPFGILAGRAKAARMRELRHHVLTGQARGYLVILFILIIMVTLHAF